jgi:hypothetical protein
MESMKVYQSIYNRAVTALVRSGRLMVASKTTSGTHIYKLG